MSFLSEIWFYMKVRKKFWLAPLVLIMVIFGGLIILAKGSAVAPFIYTIFRRPWRHASWESRPSTTTARRR